MATSSAPLESQQGWMPRLCWYLFCAEMLLRPTPIFTSGTPESVPAEVLGSFHKKYEQIGTARETEAIRYASSRTRPSTR